MTATEFEPPQVHGSLGIASFAVAMLMLVVLIGTFIVAGYLFVSRQATPTGNFIVGCVMFLAWAGDLVALGLGIGGLFGKLSKKTFPILGIVFSMGGLVLSAGLVLVGLARQHGMH